MSAALLTTIFILVAISIILLGSQASKPVGWIAVGFGVLVLLLVLFGKMLGL